MTIVSKSNEEIRSAEGRIDFEKLDAATEEDIERWKREDGVDDAALGPPRLVRVSPDVRLLPMPKSTGTARARTGDTEVLPARRRFSVDEYERMTQVGILHEDDRVELIDGEIFELAPIGSRHAARVTFLGRWFITRLGERATVSIQSPVQLSDESELEPDLVLLRPRSDDYEHALPGPGDVLLLIEVADTSLAYDRDVKLPRYARAGIPEIWIVALTSSQVLVYGDPSPAGYRRTLTLGRGDTLSSAAFPDLRLSVDGLLP